jgi:transposase-like protein
VADAPRKTKTAPKRRRFTAEYKDSILKRLEGLEGRGAASSLLREEGLYWSHVAKWRRQRDGGDLEDSWTEPWVRTRIQTLIEERMELLREIEDLAQRNDALRDQLADGGDQAAAPAGDDGAET